MVEREPKSPYGSKEPIADEAPSRAMLPVAHSAVLLVYNRGPELDLACRVLLEHGIRPKVVPSVTADVSTSAAPHYCFVDWSLEGAKEFITKVGENSPSTQVVAIVDSPIDSAKAYAAGAIATVAAPLLPEEFISCIESLRWRHERQLKQGDELDQGQRIFAATAFEATLRALGLELRTPLATGLANVEYLIDVAHAAVSPLSAEEHLAVVKDTLEAMQRIRATLEGMSVLIPWTPPPLEPVRLIRVAHRVIEGLPDGAKLIHLDGDPQVRGFGDESILVEVTSILVKRALERQPELKPPPVSLHVYAHGAEARLTVRERPTRATLRRSSEDPFMAVHGRGGGQGGLKLAAARHAIVKMGGMLNYVTSRQSGAAFRVRLRLADSG